MEIAEMKSAKVFLAVVVFVLVSGPAFADTLVTTGATVTTAGEGFNSSAATNWGSILGVYNPSTIVNGSPQADGTQWNLNTAYWSGSAPDAVDTLTITLSASATIDKIILQADNNDAYRVQYWDGLSWQNLSDFGAIAGFGLVTRPTVTFSAFTTDAFQITAIDGDGFYSVGQFSAYSTDTPTPEPSTWLLMLTGGALVGVLARRRKIAC